MGPMGGMMGWSDPWWGRLGREEFLRMRDDLRRKRED